ncbi:MAG: hypothetical protein J1F61_02270 [Clostridiales bacterium]|nr:hypothetical protein [Clostridiales bacterium]
MKNKNKSKKYKNAKEWLDKRIEEDKKSMYTESDREFLKKLIKMAEDNNAKNNSYSGGAK